MRYSRLYPSICAALILIFASSMKAEVFDPNAFSQLSPAARMDCVLAMVDERDLSLNEICYTVRERNTDLNTVSGAKKVLSTKIYEVRRRGENLWMHLKHYDGADTKEQMELYTNWNGVEARMLSFPPYLHAKVPQGTILEKANDNFQVDRYNEILGIRIYDMRQVASLPHWIRACMAAPRTEVSSALYVEGHKDAVRLTIRRGSLEYRLLFDVAHGFALEELEREYTYGKAHNYYKETSSHINLHAGIWVPEQVDVIAQTAAVPSSETHVIYELESFKGGPITEKEIEVAFPPGTEVLDKINHVAYTTTASGGYSLLPLADSRMQTLAIPPEGAVTNQINATTRDRMYRITPLTLKPQPSALYSSRVIVWVLGTLGMIAVLIGVFDFLRRRGFVSRKAGS